MLPAFKQILVGDYESYYSDDYTLKRLSTESYVRDPRFEAHGKAMRWPDGTTRWYVREQLPALFASINWRETAIVHHHSAFDALIDSHHYDVFPALHFDTLSMSRLLLGNHVSVSLDSVRSHFGLPAKTTPYNLFKGKHWHEMTPEVQRLVAAGACDEVESIWKIFKTLMASFPLEEIETVDATIRMFSEPCLRGDVPLFEQVWHDEEASKAQRLAALGFDITTEAGRIDAEKQLASADKFAALLRAEGIEPGTKPGKPHDDGSEKLIYAFAKDDDFMRELLEYEDERIATLAQARLSIKSTLLQTRAESLADASRRGYLPVYQNYCGAVSTRWSSSDGLNLDNLPRGAKIREGFLAPKGFLLGVIDLKTIECILLNFFARQWDKIEEFRAGKDPYVGVASAFYGFAVDPAVHKVERQVGKTIELQCGYQSGALKIYRTLRKNGLPVKPEDGLRGRDAYRNTHRMVVNYWQEGENVLRYLASSTPMTWGPMEIKGKRIYLPNGAPVIFDTLEWAAHDDGSQEWRIKTRKGWDKMYGGKVVATCLSANTKVLTVEGWKRIVDVTVEDRVWDGVGWVSHAGVVERGEQNTISVDGIRMTEDHGVLTTDGWIRAAQTSGLYRAKVRLPDSASGCGHNRTKTPLGSTMHLRQQDYQAEFGVSKTSIVRVHEIHANKREEPYTRKVFTSAIPYLERCVGAVHVTVWNGLEKLRRQRDSRLRALGKIREFLEGHESFVSAWINARTRKQQRELQPAKLCVGGNTSASIKSAYKPPHQYPVGSHDRCRSVSKIRHRSNNPTVSRGNEMAGAKLVYQAGLYEQTYDIVDCGPRNRFVVQGDTEPMLVHNCTQALARVVASQALIRIKRAGVHVAKTTHDELWVIIRDDAHAEKTFQFCMDEMKRAEGWLKDVPLGCEGAMAERYAKP